MVGYHQAEGILPGLLFAAACGPLRVGGKALSLSFPLLSTCALLTALGAAAQPIGIPESRQAMLMGTGSAARVWGNWAFSWL